MKINFSKCELKPFNITEEIDLDNIFKLSLLQTVWWLVNSGFSATCYGAFSGGFDRGLGFETDFFSNIWKHMWLAFFQPNIKLCYVFLCVWFCCMLLTINLVLLLYVDVVFRLVIGL
jgi:hypothetical protein